MAELAGSIIGIVSAGTKVALVLSQLAADVGSAGQEARMIGSEIRSFCTVLKTLGNALEKIQGSEYYGHCFEMVQDMTDASLEMFTEILNAVENLRSMAVGKDGKDGKFSFVGKVQWVVFQKPKILVLRAAIEAYKSNLALMLGTLDVTEKVARRASLPGGSEVSTQEDQERTLLESLSLDHRTSLINLDQAEREYNDGQSDDEYLVIPSAEESKSSLYASPRTSIGFVSTISSDFLEEAKDEVLSMRHSLQSNATLDAASLQAQVTQHSNRLSGLIETDQKRLSERWSTALTRRSGMVAVHSRSTVTSETNDTRNKPQEDWIISEARNDVKYQAMKAWIADHPLATRRLILAALTEDTSPISVENATRSNMQQMSEPIVAAIADQMMNQWAQFVQNFGAPIKISEANKLISYDITLSDQDITELPSAAVYTLSRERTVSLTLARNRLKTVPSTLCLCSHLTSLDLGNNNFDKIPDAIRSVPKLHALDLRSNHLRYIPSWIAEMNNLKVLSLSNNNIQGVPPAIGKMATLEILDLTGNHVVSPSEYMVSLLCPGYDEQSFLDQISGSNPTERNILLNKHRTRRVKAALRIIENSSISITDAQAIAGELSNGALSEMMCLVKPLWPTLDRAHQAPASIGETMLLLQKTKDQPPEKPLLVVSPSGRPSASMPFADTRKYNHTRSRSQETPTHRNPISPGARERKAHRNSSVYAGTFLGETPTSGFAKTPSRLKVEGEGERFPSKLQDWFNSPLDDEPHS